MEQPETGAFWTAVPAPFARPGLAPAAPMAGQRTVQIAMPMLQQLLLTLRQLESAQPVEQVVHSLHHQAMMDTRLNDLPAMKRFTEAGVHNLHAMTAAAGYIRRLLHGETDRAVLAGLQDQMKVLQQSHQEARTAFTQLMAAEPARAHDVVRGLGQVLNMKEQVFRAIQPTMQMLTAIELPAPQ